MAKKFDIVLETALGRYTNNAGFLVGDYVTFKKKFKSIPCYENLGDNVKKMIDEILSSDKLIRVRGISNVMPSRAPGNTENMNGMVTITIAVDEGGGREYNYVTVPHNLLELVELDGANLPKLPKSMNYDKESHNTVGQAKETKEVVANSSFKNSGSRELPKTNTKLKYATEPSTAFYIQSF